ncbi:clostripain-related cysteine peptidase [Bacteroides sp. UBA939]|uniref:clostripain-related cysteine peptidase n=1 Tax=Bacteroides sp. UBA939 TaxID=1946092 RepID=UPI0025BCB8B6|nr:clostripain-related cysteine peptidase [Bacteroides sp. UBA939]
MKIKFYFLFWICLSVLVAACCDDEPEPDVVAVTDVILNRSELSLEKGGSEILEAIITPDNATNKKVSWKSSDTNVATVDVNGKVTALKDGMAIIVAVTEDGAKIATCRLVCGGSIVDPDIRVMDVTLNKSVLSLKEGDSETLEAIITPDNATNKKAIWMSSDKSIVIVGANGKVTALQPGTATVVVVTEDGAKTAACEVTVEPVVNPIGSRTVLAYIAADNSLRSFALQDLAEMKIGMGKVTDANAHLLVYIDDGSSPRLLELKKQGGTVVETVVKTYESRNSVGVSETREVFAEVFSNPKYNADSYGLVYWSHGDGWLPYPLRPGTRWVGQDTGDGDKRMNISEFVEILGTAPHFDFILFDACFMQSVEVAYELQDYTDYCIGSPTEIPGPGASYDVVVPAMFSTTGNIAVNVAHAYFEPYEAKYDAGRGISNSNWTGGASVCALKTGQLVNLATVTKQVLPSTVNVTSLRSSVFDYDCRRGGRVGYYDLAGMMKKITTGDVAYKTWKQVYDAAVVYWATTPENYSAYVEMFPMEDTNGVSCYIPSAANNITDEVYRATEWYTAAGFDKLY